MATYTEQAVVPGSIQNDAFYFTLNVNGQNIQWMILDTGAFELTFNGQVAQALNLPNLGAIQIGGVGGAAAAYKSKCNLHIGGQVYSDVPCIVDPNFSSPGLFGLRFFVDNHFSVLVDTVNEEFMILAPSTP